MDNTFAISITMGNEAMNTPEHIAAALQDVARKLTENSNLSGKIYDQNGNSVGSFGFSRFSS